MNKNRFFLIVLCAGVLFSPAAHAEAQIFEKFSELGWPTILVLAALFASGILLIFGSKKAGWNSRRIASASMCIAISFVLSLIHLYRMPQGGTITLASMLPLILFSMANGPVRGFAVGVAFGLLQLLSDPYIVHPIQVLVDYPLAYGAMTLCVLAKWMPLKRLKLPAAVVLAYLGRYAMAVTSGTVFFADYAGEQNALLYSLLYNAAYLGFDLLACMAVAFLPGVDRLQNILSAKA